MAFYIRDLYQCFAGGRTITLHSNGSEKLHLGLRLRPCYETGPNRTVLQGLQETIS
jgi:hypothetical protein